MFPSRNDFHSFGLRKVLGAQFEGLFGPSSQWCEVHSSQEEVNRKIKRIIERFNQPSKGSKTHQEAPKNIQKPQEEAFWSSKKC